MSPLELIIIGVIVVLAGGAGSMLGALVAGLALKQQVVNLVAVVLEGILNDQELMDDVFEKIVESIKKQFASSKAAAKRTQTAFDRKLARGLLKQYPIAGVLADQLDLTEYIEKNPELIFYAASKMPFLFQQPGMVAENQAGGQVPQPQGNAQATMPINEDHPNRGQII